MRRAFMDLDPKEKLFFFIMLSLGYFSPVIGVVLWFFAKRKTEKKILQYAGLAGAALALVWYVGNYVYLLWT